MNRKEKITDLRQQVLDNIAKNDDIICDLCDEIINLAKQERDTQSIAFAYIWRADHYFYVHFNLQQLFLELENAKRYIDTKQMNELVEKYYTLLYVFYEYTYDVKSSLKYALKALKVAEEANIGYRIGVAYGNIGNIYFDHDCFEEALEYTHRALDVIKSLPEARPGLVRLLLNNMIILYLHFHRLNEAKSCIEELAALPLANEDLKIYVDYVKVLYYAAEDNREKALHYLQQFIEDDVVKFANRSYAMEFLTYAFEAMMKIDAQQEASSLLDMYQSIIQKEEYTPKLTLSKLQVSYAKKYQDQQLLKDAYKEYFILYEIVSKQMRDLKVQGLKMKMDLVEMNSRQDDVKKNVDALEKLVNFDELTQVFNRRYFNMKRNELLNDKEDHEIGFVICDVDYFKEYNDYYGHVLGDEVLIEVARSMNDNATQQMIVCRYGGDEFVMLSWDMDAQALQAYVQKVQADLQRKAIEHSQSKCSEIVTLSIGYGVGMIHYSTDTISLFEQVDKALYYAKNQGRNNAKSIHEIPERIVGYDGK